MAEILFGQKTFGSTGFDDSFGIVTDATGNIFTSGEFSGVADFDPGPQTSTLSSSGGYDIFVSKLDINGDFIWAKNIGGIYDDVGSSITLDVSGNIYLAGSFEVTVDFDPSPAIYNLASNGNADIFISKLDSFGNFVWAKSAGGISYDAGASVTTDTFGTIYCTGSFAATVDFDPGAGVA